MAFVRPLRQFLCGICEISKTISVWHLWDQQDNFCVTFASSASQFLYSILRSVRQFLYSVCEIGRLLQCSICEISETTAVWHTWDHYHNHPVAFLLNITRNYYQIRKPFFFFELQSNTHPVPLDKSQSCNITSFKTFQFLPKVVTFHLFSGKNPAFY